MIGTSGAPTFATPTPAVATVFDIMIGIPTAWPITPRRRGGMGMSNEKQCERCGEDIPEARMRALPETRLCLDCSQEIGGDFVTYVVAENTGKPGSLKKNYGSWSVKRKLRPITPKKAE
jgi:hypothetical protein